MRRSSRLADTLTGSESSTAQPTLESSITSPPPKKRAKNAPQDAMSATKSKARRRRGKLESLPDMPLDVLFEIFGHLQPLDVLILARSTKALRGILMNRRSAISIWKTALSNCPGLPECPFDLTEPQYINLAFSKHCHFCLALSVPKVLWALRVRCCKKCLKDQVTSLNGRDHSRLHEEEKTLMPWERVGPEYSPYNRSRPFYCCLNSTRTNLRSELCAHPGDKRRGFVEDRLHHIGRIQEHAKACAAWQEKLGDDRSQQLQEIRHRRASSIQERLTDLGWGYEIEKMDFWQFSNLSVVRQPKDLTDRAWEKIKPELVQYMETIRAERIVNDRPYRTMGAVKVLERLLHNYGLTRPSDELVLNLPDVCLLLPFKAVITETSPDEDISKEHFEDAMEQLPRLSEEWRESATLYLLQQFNISRDTTIDPACLQLAIALFRCTHCNQHTPLTSTEAMAHRDIAYLGLARSLSEADKHFLQAFIVHNCQPWREKYDNFIHDASLDRAARNVVAACGQDPDNTTAREMDALDPWLECQQCCRERRTESVMHWRLAAGHMAHWKSAGHDKSREEDDPRMWRLLDHSESERVRTQVDKTSATTYLCMRCRCQTTDRQTHLASKHGIMNIELTGFVHAPTAHPTHPISLPAPETDSGGII
ncbi:hypothetical protein PLICRDRAFT_367809 [Plicaturopsis crispa FD-325 SS-3]|uniref:F-box domain-containing protein n=1 Tax=Plicaturopsis crispa FD-325 SS-3 TaxID=944288 RepID=A0A0C9SX09_PLICR|nr:hypothetical protein PLICRDRAFT_367809 [Plicaturopsis crispa FD-325 SS-3]